MKKILSFLLSLAVSMQCLSFTVNAESVTESPESIRTIAVDFSDDNAVEITLTEGEQVQLVIPDEPDMPEINYIAFSASNQIAAVSHDLKLTGICAGQEYVKVYIERRGMSYEEQQTLRLHILKNDSLPAENRAELERLNQLDGFYRRKMELVGALNEDAPRLDMEKVQEIIDTSGDYMEILMRLNQYHGYADIYPAGGGHTSYSYWFDPKGNESICYILEEEFIAYTKTADDGTVIGVQGLYPEKTEFLPNGKDKNYEYVQYNQIQPKLEGYGTLTLNIIDGTTNEPFTETNGKFQLISDDEVIKSWDVSEGSEITISDLSRESTYEIRYIDDYHGGVLFDQQYRYEIDHDKGTSCFSFGYDSEVSCKVYMKKRHRGDPYLLGDVNGDNRFNVADVVTLQKWLLGKPDTVLMNWEAADLCMDGKLDVFDLCLMKRELIEKMNEDSQNVDTSFELQSVADIRTNSDSHKKWTGFIVRSENDLKDIIKENECVSADEFSIEGIDSSIFKDKSLIIVYSICTAGNSYSVIDNISVKDTGIDVSTISKKPMIATPDMLYRRYIYLVDKNAVTNVDGFTFNDASSYYQDDEEKDVAKWYKEWCQS